MAERGSDWTLDILVHGCWRRRTVHAVAHAVLVVCFAFCFYSLTNTLTRQHDDDEEADSTCWPMFMRGALIPPSEGLQNPVVLEALVDSKSPNNDNTQVPPIHRSLILIFELFASLCHCARRQPQYVVRLAFHATCPGRDIVSAPARLHTQEWLLRRGCDKFADRLAGKTAGWTWLTNRR